jgi:hypothetical protein
MRPDLLPIIFELDIVQFVLDQLRIVRYNGNVELGIAKRNALLRRDRRTKETPSGPAKVNYGVSFLFLR